jgi:aminotransferase in exopolysaccharide biosynthesis
MNNKYQAIIDFIQDLYQSKDFIALHEPKFIGNEKIYLNECVDSTFVSSAGKYVDQFEDLICKFTGSKYAVATVNGTAALHVSLQLAGVNRGDEVLTQSLTFVATSNAINYCGASPVFLDVDLDTLGLSPESLRGFLINNTSGSSLGRMNKKTGKKIAAVLPMHTFGHPCRIEEILNICEEFGIPLVEDAAESLGSFYKKKHTGTFGVISALSFNGNKIITTGGGGMILTNNKSLAEKAKHITTTAKKPHSYEFIHDEIGYNYRMPNINAALGCAQMENVKKLLSSKRTIANAYSDFLNNQDIKFIHEPINAKSNYWLNSLLLKDKECRDNFLKELNDAGVMCRPLWRLMNDLIMFNNCETSVLTNSKWLEDRLVNVPSRAKI